MHEGFQQIYEGVIPPGDRGWFVETAPNPSTDSLDRSTARQLAVNRHLCLLVLVLCYVGKFFNGRGPFLL